MKKILGLLAILIPLAASAAQPRSVALVIQENGNVQVSETQDLEPAGPDGLVRISPLPETLLPASVNAVPLERGETLEIAASFLGRRADPALVARVGLEARADDPVSSFSAGMRKRLALARVLLQAKPIVLLDEPYGELDPPGFALLDGVVGELRASGATVIMATHLVDHGRRLCDHALLLEAGRLAWSGPAAAMPAEAPAGSGPR